MGRARIGTCSGLADAALVRSALEAHDIPVVINAEQHATMLGGIGGAFVPLHIYVDGEHAEEAAALLRDLREREQGEAAAAAPDAAGAVGAVDGDGVDGEESGDDGADDDDDDAPSDVDLRVERRRRAGIVLLLSCFIPLGGIGHLLTGAWLRGLALVGVQGLAFSYLVAGRDSLAVGLFAACKGVDIIGALGRIYARGPDVARLPVARMHLR